MGKRMDEWNKRYAEHKDAEFATIAQQQAIAALLAVVHAAFAYRLALHERLEEDDCFKEKQLLFGSLDELGKGGWWPRYVAREQRPTKSLYA